MRRIDLTGKRFGALTALRPVSASETQDHRPGWLVRCDCGHEKIVNGSNLRRGKITSCGCGIVRGQRVSKSLASRQQHEDIAGKTYGDLTAMYYIRYDYWHWRCSCGKETDARPSLVKSGKIQSCGHVLSATAKAKIEIQNTVEHFDGTTVSRLRHIMASPETKGIRKKFDRRREPYWQARITIRGKAIHLGTFATEAEAKKARKRAEEQYYLPIIEEFERMKHNGD